MASSRTQQTYEITTARPAIRASLIRGGTSKGVFFHLADLPDFGPELDALLLDVMGSPDPMQIDGLGGTYSSTSKVIIVAPGDRPGIDVRYWFAEIGIDEPIVDWSGNCGNLTMAVGPFAIEEGLVKATEPECVLHLLNENTGVEIVAKFSVENGLPKEHGDLLVSGVPNRGAPIVTDFLAPGGAVLGAVLPTGSASDVIVTEDGEFDVSIVDVTHPNAFVAAAELGIDLADASPSALNGDAELLAKLNRLRTAAAALVSERTGYSGGSPNVPRLVLVAAPNTPDPDADLLTLSLSLGKFHHAMPMTSALCLGGAVAISGTVPAKLAGGLSSGRLGIRHPKGVVAVSAEVHETTAGPDVVSVGVIRTARRLMTGLVYPRTAG